MEKIDQIEMLKNVQTKIAQDFGMQRLLQPVDLTDEEMANRCKHQLFDALKQEVSSRLSSLDALFNASVVLQDNDLSVEIARFLDDISSELNEFITSISSFDDEDEEGGDSEIS